MRRAAWLLLCFVTATGVAQPAPVDINHASIQALTDIPYIGRKRAEAIVNGRPWHSVDDLAARRVVPRKYLDKIEGRFEVR
jgi:DNA uptake protein ComE-like DNA-binding protein